MGTRNVFNGSVGVVAENATVGNVVVGDAGSVRSSIDKRTLFVDRLGELARRVDAAPAQIDRGAEAGVIAQARTQVEAGDESGAWATLKKLSAWTLGAARDIGVDIAAAVIRQQAGLP